MTTDFTANVIASRDSLPRAGAAAFRSWRQVRPQGRHRYRGVCTSKIVVPSPGDMRHPTHHGVMAAPGLVTARTPQRGCRRDTGQQRVLRLDLLGHHRQTEAVQTAELIKARGVAFRTRGPRVEKAETLDTSILPTQGPPHLPGPQRATREHPLSSVKSRELSLEKVSVQVTAENNDAHFFDVPSDVPIVPHELTAHVSIESQSLNAAEIDAFIHEGEQRCPIASLIRNPNTIHVLRTGPDGSVE